MASAAAPVFCVLMKPSLLEDWEKELLSKKFPEKETESMIETILRLYTASMLGEVHSPTPHLIGPPGCGKSTSVEQAAKMLGVQVHTINVSRLNPLEIEGIQMPIDGNTKLHALTATFWTRIREGDIVFFDEFLRGFPEVYNGLLDIFTSRQVGSFKIPKAFFIAASNSVVTYDKALEDRLLHVAVDDPRNSTAARKHLKQLLVNGIGLSVAAAEMYECDEVMRTEVLPMYDMLDTFKGKARSSAANVTGHSVRNLIGQARLRQIESDTLRTFVDAASRQAIHDRDFTHVVLTSGKSPDDRYVRAAKELRGNARLTAVEAANLEINLQLINMEAARVATNEVPTENEEDEDELDFS